MATLRRRIAVPRMGVNYGPQQACAFMPVQSAKRFRVFQIDGYEKKRQAAIC